ncbi:hypothetical protein D9M72_594080 [compost metagenome]
MGHDDGDPPVGGFGATQLRPVDGKACGKTHPIFERLMADNVSLDSRIVDRRRLERDGARENATVDLRQRNVHRQIARHQPLRRCLPLRPRRAGEDHLQHRRAC